MSRVRKMIGRRTKLENFTSKLSGLNHHMLMDYRMKNGMSWWRCFCVYLVEDEEEKPELVTIEPITDDQFAAGIDDDKLKINYSIKTTESIH